MLYLGAKKSLLSSGKTLAQQVAAMFAGGEQGAWYEPSLTNGTLFQDSAGTTPVTAVGQPVGLMLDKSGRGNHCSQPTTVNRPILQIDGNGRHFLAFNGTNSWMSTPAIDFTATDKMTVVAGVSSLPPANQTILLEPTGGFGYPGSFAIVRAQTEYGIYGYSSAGATALKGARFTTPPKSCVITGQINFDLVGAAEVGIRANAVAGALLTNPTQENTGVLGNRVLNIGSRNGFEQFFGGQFYGLIIRGALSSDGQIAAAEKHMNAKTGAY